LYRFRQTNSFIENSIEAGILLGGNGILHAMLVARALTSLQRTALIVFSSLLALARVLALALALAFARALALALALTPLALNALAFGPALRSLARNFFV
jgi:hypothetical protein